MIFLLFCIIFIIGFGFFTLLTHKGKYFFCKIYYTKGRLNEFSTTISVAILHFFISYFLFGFLFAMGESGESGSFLVKVLAFFYTVIGFNPFFILLHFLDAGTPRIIIPNFLYFPVSFIFNSLLWGLVITLVLKLIIRRFSQFRKK